MGKANVKSKGKPNVNSKGIANVKSKGKANVKSKGKPNVNSKDIANVKSKGIANVKSKGKANVKSKGKALGTLGMLLHKKTLFNRYYCIHSTKFARKFTKIWHIILSPFHYQHVVRHFHEYTIPGPSQYPYMLIKETYRSAVKTFSDMK